MKFYFVLPPSQWNSLINVGIATRDENDACVPLFDIHNENPMKIVPRIAKKEMGIRKNGLLFSFIPKEGERVLVFEKTKEYDMLGLERDRVLPVELRFVCAFDVKSKQAVNIRHLEAWQSEWEIENDAMLHGRVAWTAQEYDKACEYEDTRPTDSKTDRETWLGLFFRNHYGKKLGTFHFYRCFKIISFLNEHMNQLESDGILVKGSAKTGKTMVLTNTALFETLCTAEYNHDTGQKGFRRYTFNYDEIVERVREGCARLR